METNEFRLLVREVIKECMDEMAPNKKKNTIKLKKSHLKEMIKEMVKEYLKEAQEGSYKIVSPNSVDTAEEDKSRTIQKDPTVNETSYKVQGPSAKTFKDSPQFPKAVDDPENA